MNSSMTYFSPSLVFRKYTATLCVFLLCGGVIACNGAPTSTPPTLAVLPIQETYSQAESLAKAWQSDAQLHSANFDIIINSSSDNFWCSYVFLSTNSPKFLMVFVKITESGYDLETTEDFWPADRPIGTEISLEDVQLESQEALNLIMENGGYSFFERYHIRENRFPNVFFLKLERLDEYNGDGPVLWTSGFGIDNPHAQLYISLEDATGDLLKVKAFGEQEEEYWLHDLIVTEQIPIKGSKNFFEMFDLRLDNITEENGRRYADLTIISAKTPGLIRGELTHTHIKQDSVLPFGEYEITLVRIDREWIELEVMPSVRWYKPKPEC